MKNLLGKERTNKWNGMPRPDDYNQSEGSENWISWIKGRIYGDLKHVYHSNIGLVSTFQKGIVLEDIGLDSAALREVTSIRKFRNRLRSTKVSSPFYPLHLFTIIFSRLRLLNLQLVCQRNQRLVLRAI